MNIYPASNIAISSYNSFNTPETATNIMNNIHNTCQNEAIAHNTTISGGMQGIHVETNTLSAISEYAQCVSDNVQFSDKSGVKGTPILSTSSLDVLGSNEIDKQEKKQPTAIMSKIGANTEEQHIGHIGGKIGDFLSGKNQSIGYIGNNSHIGDNIKNKDEYVPVYGYGTCNIPTGDPYADLVAAAGCPMGQ